MGPQGSRRKVVAATSNTCQSSFIHPLFTCLFVHSGIPLTVLRADQTGCYPGPPSVHLIGVVRRSRQWMAQKSSFRDEPEEGKSEAWRKAMWSNELNVVGINSFSQFLIDCLPLFCLEEKLIGILCLWK